MTTLPLSDQIALVTGAGRGIGRAAALALAAAGAQIVAVAKTQGGLEALDDEIRALTGRSSNAPQNVTCPSRSRQSMTMSLMNKEVSSDPVAIVQTLAAREPDRFSW